MQNFRQTAAVKDINLSKFSTLDSMFDRLKRSLSKSSSGIPRFSFSSCKVIERKKSGVSVANNERKMRLLTIFAVLESLAL